MKEALKTSLGLALVLLAAACGDGASANGDAQVDDTKTVFREITTVLTSMRDEESARVGAEQLKALTDRLQKVKEREKSLSPEEYIAIYGSDDELKGLRLEMMREAFRLSTDETLAPYIEDAYVYLDR